MLYAVFGMEPRHVTFELLYLFIYVYCICMSTIDTYYEYLS